MPIDSKRLDLFREAFRYSSDLFLILERDGRVVIANHSVHEIFGEIKGRKFLRILQRISSDGELSKFRAEFVFLQGYLDGKDNLICLYLRAQEQGGYIYVVGKKTECRETDLDLIKWIRSDLTARQKAFVEIIETLTGEEPPQSSMAEK